MLARRTREDDEVMLLRTLVALLVVVSVPGCSKEVAVPVLYPRSMDVEPVECNTKPARPTVSDRDYDDVESAEAYTALSRYADTSDHLREVCAEWARRKARG